MNETAEFILCIEGIPLITRFKTTPSDFIIPPFNTDFVLKVFLL